MSRADDKMMQFSYTYGTNGRQVWRVRKTVTKDLRIGCDHCKNYACYFWVDGVNYNAWCRECIFAVKRPSQKSIWMSESELVSLLIANEVMSS